MPKGVREYLQQKGKERLLKQWVDKAGLPPEELSVFTLEDQKSKEELDNNQNLEELAQEHQGFLRIDNGVIHLPIRYALISVYIVIALLVALSVVSTILITRP